MTVPQTTELERAKEEEREGSSGLESELAQAERTVGELRAEVAGVKQDLQDAMDLCSQHEALMEERNRDLETCDTEIRSVSLSVQLMCSDIRLVVKLLFIIWVKNIFRTSFNT